MIGRLLRKLLGCSRRSEMVKQALREHSYAAQRSSQESKQKLEQAELLVSFLKKDIYS